MAVLPLSPFVEGLARSQLLDAEQLREVRDLQGRFPNPRELAQELLRREWLTAYQVNQIFQGKEGDLIVGQYILQERLGEGGMGQVFKARQRNLSRVVALKVIRRDYLNNPKVIKRFEREIRATGVLSHTNIVHAFDADQVDGTYFIAMEFIDGIDLSKMVRQDGPLLVPQALDYIRQAALGLQHAHEQGMVHRDIKPANLLVTRSAERRNGSGAAARPASGLLARPNRGTSSSGFVPRPAFQSAWGIVKILDMGLARLNDPEGNPAGTHLTQMGTIVGTPDYIAPEQATNSHTSDIRGDIYSLGCTLYYLLCGQPPFDGTLLEKLLQHQKDKPVSVSKVRRARLLMGLGQGQAAPPREILKVPSEVKQILAKMMAKHPRDRFQTPGELAAALADLLNRFAAHQAAANDKTELESPAPKPAVPVAVANTVFLEKPPDEPPAATSRAPHARPRWQRWFVEGGKPRKIAIAAVLAAALLAGMVLSQIGGKKPQPNDGGAVESAATVLWKKLVHRAQQKPPVDLEELRLDLVQFRAQHASSPHAREVADLLATLPSPLDELARDKIEKRQLFDWQPKEVVGIFGQWKPGFDFRHLHSLAISPDGRWLVSGGGNGQVRTWDLATQEEHQFPAHTRNIFRLAFAPDGRSFATASFDGTVKLWDTATRNLLHTLVKADRPLFGERLRMTSVAFNQDGTRLATAGFDETIRLFDLGTGSELQAVRGQVGKIGALAYSPDGQWLFWSGETGQVRWAGAGGLAIDADRTYRSGPGFKVLAISPDGKTLVVGDGLDGSLRLCAWDGMELKEVARLEGHAAFVHDVAFAPDSRTFVSVSEDRFVKLWDVQAAKPIRSWEMRWPVVGAAFAPDGRHFATANANSTVYVFRPALSSPEDR